MSEPAHKGARRSGLLAHGLRQTQQVPPDLIVAAATTGAASVRTRLCAWSEPSTASHPARGALWTTLLGSRILTGAAATAASVPKRSESGRRTRAPGLL